jgi:uncharacterized protein
VARSLRVNDYHLFRENGRGHVWIVPISALFTVDDDAYAMLSALLDSRGRELDTEAWRSRLPRSFTRATCDEFLEELKTLGIVLMPGEKADDPGIRTDNLLRFSQPPIGTLTTMISKDCNLGCGYCYADEGRFGGTAGGRMSFEMSRRALDMQLAASGNLPEIRYQFLGGEPLLSMKIIREVVEYGEAAAARAGKRIHFGLTTNATLLTEEVVRFLLEHDIRVTVSIDGPKEVNDAVRVDHGGRGSYERIMRAAAPLLRARPTRARVTVTCRNVDVVAIVDHLLAAGFYEVGLTPVNSTDPDFALSDVDRETLMHGYRMLIRRYVAEARAGRLYGFANLTELLKQIHEGRSQAHPCGAGIQLVAADAEGTLYPCHRFPGHAEYALGHVDTGIDRRKQAEWLEKVNVHNRSACATCWARYICSGGCYYLSAIEYGDVSQTFTEICDHLRDWYQLGLATYAEIAESCPEFFSRIGMGNRATAGASGGN